MNPTPPFFIKDGSNIRVFVNSKDPKYQEMIAGIVSYLIMQDKGLVN